MNVTIGDADMIRRAHTVSRTARILTERDVTLTAEMVETLVMLAGDWHGSCHELADTVEAL